MIEGVPVGDVEGQDASSSKLKLLGVAISMVAIMLLVSIQGWIIDDVVDEIKEHSGDLREECPYRGLVATSRVAATVTSWKWGITVFWRRTTSGTLSTTSSVSTCP